MQFDDYELEEFLFDAGKLKRKITDGDDIPKSLDDSFNRNLDRLLTRPTRRAIRPDVGGFSQSRGKIFESFGEQLQVIYRASQPGQEPDQRLYKVRAATGLSEGVPSDGGFLLEQTFSREIFTTAFANAQIAPLCREIPIGDNSNSVKINAVAESSRVSTRWGGILGYWLSEAGTKTASAPKFRQMELSLKKFVVLCYESMAHRTAMSC